MSGVLNIMGVLYSSTLFVGISNCLSVQHIVAVQRAVMYRERAAGTYGVLPFSLAQVRGLGDWCTMHLSPGQAVHFRCKVQRQRGRMQL